MGLPVSILITMKVPELVFFEPSLHYQVASFPGHPDFSMLHAEKGEGLVRDVTCAVPALFENERTWAVNETAHHKNVNRYVS